MTKANDTQVGGGHYKTKIEHWDYVVANKLNYFEGQITKYVTRCRNKNGMQDLEKARHFLDKYMEIYLEVEGHTFVQVSTDLNNIKEIAGFSDDIFLYEGVGHGMSIYSHRETKQQVRAHSLAEAHIVWNRFNAPLESGESHAN